jgi:hypothetical protein
MEHLFEKRRDDVHGNVERDGQRSRSATLLVPGLEMEMFTEVGLLYDADKSTVRSYMFEDSVTRFQNAESIQGGDQKQNPLREGAYQQFSTADRRTPDNPKEFYNVNEDRKKFQPILSRKDFIAKYKKFRADLEDPSSDLSKHRTKIGKSKPENYNEVICNFYPEGLVGIYGINLPINVLDEKGRVSEWQPSPTEIEEIRNFIQQKVSGVQGSVQERQRLCAQHYENLGLTEGKKLSLLSNIKEQAKEALKKVTSIKSDKITQVVPSNAKKAKSFIKHVRQNFKKDNSSPSR